MDQSKKILELVDATQQRCKLCNVELPADTWVPWCEGCAAGGKVARAAKDRAWLEEQRRAEAERRRCRLEAVLADVPGDALLDSPELLARVKRREAIDEARAAAAPGAIQPVVLLVGGAGAGKTSIASALVRNIVARALAGDRDAERLAWSAMWASAPQLARARREHKLGAGEAPEVARALAASLLVIDDLGLDREDRDGALAEVIYERHASKLPTIVTTGKTRRELLAAYGDGIVRRLTERPHAMVIPCATLAREAAQASLPGAGAGS